MKRECEISVALWRNPCNNKASVIRRDKAGRAVHLCEKCDRAEGGRIGTKE
jgi:hypothetical protein